MTDKTDIVIELVKGLRDDAREHRTEMRDHQKESKNWHLHTNDRLTAIEIDLREHKEGVIQNRSVITKVVKRLDVVEEPSKVISVLKKWLLGAAAVAAAIITISKLMGLF